MLQSSYKYSDSINAKGDQFSTESLLLSLVFEQDKLINKNKLTKNPPLESILYAIIYLNYIDNYRYYFSINLLFIFSSTTTIVYTK